MNPKEVNISVLAYLGDTIYENYIREYLVRSGIANVNDLQIKAIEYVSAKKQAEFLKKLIEDNFFNEEELNIIKRARNYRNNYHPKNCDIITYKHATALEALLGYLRLENNNIRIKEIVDKIIY
jgi:ribonuclease-3 family protein